MNPYIDKLKAHLAESLPCCGYPDADSLLEMLYLCYTEWNPINSGQIRQDFYTLYNRLNYPMERQLDDVLDIVSRLCAQHEKLAFLEGIRVGARLAAELDT